MQGPGGYPVPVCPCLFVNLLCCLWGLRLLSLFPHVQGGGRVPLEPSSGTRGWRQTALWPQLAGCRGLGAAEGWLPVCPGSQLRGQSPFVVGQKLAGSPQGSRHGPLLFPQSPGKQKWGKSEVAVRACGCPGCALAAQLGWGSGRPQWVLCSLTHSLSSSQEPLAFDFDPSDLRIPRLPSRSPIC